MGIANSWRPRLMDMWPRGREGRDGGRGKKKRGWEGERERERDSVCVHRVLRDRVSG